jgi:hypothetical protein
MPRGVHPNSLANLKAPWNGETARIASLSADPIARVAFIQRVNSRRPITPEKIPNRTPDCVKRVEKQFNLLSQQLTLEAQKVRPDADKLAKLALAQSRLLVTQDRLNDGSSPASTPARPAIKVKPTYLE